MKKIICPAIAICLFIGAFFVARATPTIIAGSPITVNNVSYTSAVVNAYSYNPAFQQLAVTHGALQQTTDIAIKVYLNLVQNSNAPTFIGTWYPANTNATTEYIYAGSFFGTNYAFCSITTTNSQQLYIGYGQ